MRDACSLNHRVLILACAAPRFFCLQLYDKDRITRDDFVGESTLDLCDARKLRNKRLAVPVYRGAKHRGTLSLIVNFTPNQQQTSHSNSQHAGVGTSATGCGCQSSAAGANSHSSDLQQTHLQQQQQWIAAAGPYSPSYAADDVASLSYSDLGPSVSEAAWGIEQQQQQQQQQQQWRSWPADAAYRQLDQQLTAADAAGANAHDTLLDGFFAAAAASGAAATAAGTAGAGSTACCGDGAGRAVGSVSPRLPVFAVTTPWAQQLNETALEVGFGSSNSSSTPAAAPPVAAQQYVLQDMQGLGYPAVYADDGSGGTVAAGGAVASTLAAGGDDGLPAAAAAAAAAATAQQPSQQQYPQVYAGSAAATAASDALSVGCSGSSISSSGLTAANQQQQQQQLAEQEIASSGAAFRAQLQQSLHKLHHQQQQTHAQVQANEARIEAASMVSMW
jgi:hypothetical protein